MQICRRRFCSAQPDVFLIAVSPEYTHFTLSSYRSHAQPVFFPMKPYQSRMVSQTRQSQSTMWSIFLVVYILRMYGTYLTKMPILFERLKLRRIGTKALFSMVIMAMFLWTTVGLLCGRTRSVTKISPGVVALSSLECVESSIQVSRLEFNNDLDVIWIFTKSWYLSKFRKDVKRWNLFLELMQAKLVRTELLAPCEVRCRSG